MTSRRRFVSSAPKVTYFSRHFGRPSGLAGPRVNHDRRPNVHNRCQSLRPARQDVPPQDVPHHLRLLAAPPQITQPFPQTQPDMHKNWWNQVEMAPRWNSGARAVNGGWQEWNEERRRLGLPEKGYLPKDYLRPPSAEYLASKLSDNPLGLSNMVPRCAFTFKAPDMIPANFAT
ncbi:hypothetical protein K438DRAFT_938866 [Mycena galopus ATCC 62051]|nr:hypothetical protein K438DRAFT_938866 [Mycena galopus ATCC 62051]